MLQIVCHSCGNDFSTQDLLDEHLHVHELEEEGNLDLSAPSSGGFYEQYERSILKAAKDGRISENWAKEKLKELKSRDPRGEDTGTLPSRT